MIVRKGNTLVELILVLVVETIVIVTLAGGIFIDPDLIEQRARAYCAEKYGSVKPPFFLALLSKVWR